MATKFKYAVKYPNFPVIEEVTPASGTSFTDGQEITVSGKTYVVHGNHTITSGGKVPAYLKTADMATATV